MPAAKFWPRESRNLIGPNNRELSREVNCLRDSLTISIRPPPPRNRSAEVMCRSKIGRIVIISFYSENGVRFDASSETQGQLVGTTGFSWAKVYNKSGSAPGHLLLPNEFQKCLKSRLLIGQKNFFLANQRRGTAGRLSCLLTRGCFPHQSP